MRLAGAMPKDGGEFPVYSYVLTRFDKSPRFFQKRNTGRHTSHSRHRFIFFCQLFCTFPSQMVPFINQQRCSARNSHAGQFSLVSVGHFRITQQGLVLLFRDLFRERRYNTWRSACTGMFLHPCSKLWMALSEVPNN